jgi:hypothetical protein
VRVVRAFAYVTAVVLVAIGIGVSLVGGLGVVGVKFSPARCLADRATIGKFVPMPKPTRVTTMVALPGGYELVPAPRSYSPSISAADAWNGSPRHFELYKETTATYQLLLGRVVVPDNLPGHTYSDVIAWVTVGENIAAWTIAPTAAPATCSFGSGFVVYNATTGRPLFSG